MYFLWQELGISTLAGLGFMVCFLMPLNILIGRKTRDLSQQQMKLKDERINLTNEALLGVKLIKLYGWEEPFQNRISGFIHFRFFLLRSDLEKFKNFRYS